MITAERLRELLTYDPDTGVFRWRHRIMSKNRPSRRGGRVAGYYGADLDYVQIFVEGRLHYAHRLAWLYMTGEWPPHEIDHANCMRQDNRWKNLRLSTRQENGRNLRLSKANKSGFKGVSALRAGAWTAQIHLQGTKHHLGVFDCRAAAHFAYLIASDKLHRDFGRAF